MIKKENRYQKTYIFSALTGLGAGIWLWVNKYQLPALLVFVACLFVIFHWLMDYYRLQKAKQKQMLLAALYFLLDTRIYLSSGNNVYQALNTAAKVAEYSIKPAIDKLLDNMDKDKTIVPFVEFADIFNQPIIKEILLSLYQYDYRKSEGESITGFINLLGEYRDEMVREREIYINRHLDHLLYLPLASGAILIVALALGIMQSIGGIVYGF